MLWDVLHQEGGSVDAVGRAAPGGGRPGCPGVAAVTIEQRLETLETWTELLRQTDRQTFTHRRSGIFTEP